jgi:hypothetical protein
MFALGAILAANVLKHADVSGLDEEGIAVGEFVQHVRRFIPLCALGGIVESARQKNGGLALRLSESR